MIAKLAFSKKDIDRERLLVYLNDRRTFDDLCKIYEDYSDAANPFVQYEKETGDIVRKYSKKHNMDLELISLNIKMEKSVPV